MAYDLEEQEQIDELRAFWNRYGNLILTLVTVVALAVAGWRGWEWWQQRQAVQAAGVYARIQQAAQANDAAKARGAATELMEEYSSTAYAPMGALVAAKLQVDAGDTKAAAPLLAWVVDKGRDDGLRPIARLRLAGLLLDEKRIDEGLKLLSAAPPARFVPLFADRRGDLLIAQDKRDEARAAYKEAFDGLSEGDPMREVVRLKLDALGGAAA